MVSTLYSTESTVVLVEYPSGDSSEYTLDVPEYQPRLFTSKLKRGGGRGGGREVEKQPSKVNVGGWWWYEMITKTV